MDIKALKLSDTMINAIINAERAESTTEPGHWLLLPVGKDATMRALESRGLAERGNGASGYSLTSDGRDVHEAMTPASEDHPTESDMITDTVHDLLDGSEAAEARMSARMAALLKANPFPDVEAAHGRALDMNAAIDHAARVLPVRIPGAFMEAQSEDDDRAAFDAETDAQWADVEAGEAFDRRGDAERAFDAENAAMEAASIRAEHEAEIAEEAATVTDYIDVELDMALIFAEVSRAIEETFDDDRLMHLTSKGVFVSQSYLSTMRRIAAQRAFSRQEWREYQGVVQAQSGEAFKTIDQWVADGKISFRMADKQKRIIRNTCRPSVRKGRKHKASKSR